MIVFATINVGLADCRLASAIDRSTAAASCPSIGPITFQPYASNRLTVSSVNQCLTSPSIEIPLSS